MHLRRIRLENYRRHRETEFEFPDGVIALLGRNGSGKSTILEAVGFALFGTRATRTGKELIRHDRAAPGDSVRVELDLQLAGQAVQVVRELRGKNLTPQASLTVDGHTVVPPQTGSSDAVTQEIEARIGMDREAFFTTVVARQKELSRLTDQTPADRKRLILGMLGIDAVDRAIQAARKKRRDAEVRVEALRGDMPDLQALRNERKDAGDAIAKTAAAVETAKRAWDTAKEDLAKAEAVVEGAQKAHEQRRTLLGVQERLQDRLAAERRRLETAQTQLAEAEQATRTAKGLEAAAADRDPAREALEAARDLRHRHERLQEAKKEAERWRKEHEAIEVPEAPNGLVERLRADVGVREKDHAAARERLTVVATEIQRLQDRLRRTASLTEEASCPVCDRPLEGHLPDLQDHLERERDEKEAARREADEDAAAAKRELDETRSRLEEVTKQAQAHERKAAEKAAAAKRVEEAEARVATLSKDLPPLADVEALQRRVQEAEAAHEKRTRALATAETLPARRKEAEAAAGQRQKTEAELQEITARLQRTPDTAPRLEQARKQHAEAVRREREQERMHARAEREHAEAQQRCKHVEERLADARKRKERLRAMQEEAAYWNALVGQRGGGLLDRFKAHLVSRVGPAVSHEASRLLERFTGGRYSEVLLDEEYRLYVGDAGVPYELARFSGGESDLVHLALRLAVSRLLLERSGGADLRFLALDEVFGSLDAERRDAVLGALQELGGLYAQVLVVTHQDALRDALDSAILVEEQDNEAVLSLAGAPSTTA